MAAEQTIHLERYVPEAKALVAAAQSLADERKHPQVEPIHLLARVLDRDRGVRGAEEVFRAAGAEPRDLAIEVDSQLGRLPRSTGGLAYLSSAMLGVLGRAEKEAGTEAVTVEHLLNALTQEIRGAAAAALQAFSLGPGSLRPHMQPLRAAREAQAQGGAGTGPGTGSAGSSADTKRFTTDLVERARREEMDPVIGRDVEVRRLVQVLERRHKQHPLLVGEAGVGKTAIVTALAARIAAGEVPSSMTRLQLLQLDVSALVAGTRLRGEIDERLKQVLSAVKGSARDTALFVPGLEALLGPAGSSGGGVGDLLKPLLSMSSSGAPLRERGGQGLVSLVATTTPEGLRRIQEKDPALLRRFSVLPVDAPTAERAIEMVRGVATRYEAYHGVRIGDPAIVSSVRLAKRYLQDRALPETALDLLDEAGARKRVETDGVPAEVDGVLRRLASVRAQIASLSDDTDAMSTKTRELLEGEAKDLEPRAAELRTRLASRRSALAAHGALKAEHDRMVAQLAEARKTNELAKVGELEHVALPEVRRKLEAAAGAVTREGVPAGGAVVGEEDVALVVGEWTGIPVSRMLESEADKLLRMEERLGARVVGQAEAVRAVARAVRRGRVGLRDPGRPIGSFLFLGPSGVGKTELAKAVAEFLFDDEQSLTRLDMSEFMEKHMAQRLVGSPPGYVDSEEGGFLTEAVRRRPYSVLLFDEVEKAHADVFNLLLQVLDDGRLTDGRGRTADFSNTVAIMTSNIGSQRILETDPKLFESPEGRDALRDVLQTELRAFLRPEFLNRIDDIVVFGPLTKGNLRGIVDIQLKKLGKLLTERSLGVSLTDAAKDRLVDIGYEPGFGARPLRRAILKRIQDPLAEEILRGGYPEGSTVKVDVAGDDFTFAKV